MVFTSAYAINSSPWVFKKAHNTFVSCLYWHERIRGSEGSYNPKPPDYKQGRPQAHERKQISYHIINANQCVETKRTIDISKPALGWSLQRNTIATARFVIAPPEIQIRHICIIIDHKLTQKHVDKATGINRAIKVPPRSKKPGPPQTSNSL